MHWELASQPKDYLEKQEQPYLKQKHKNIVSDFCRTKKPPTISEELILTAAVYMGEVVLGKEVSQKRKAIILFDNTVTIRFDSISEDVRLKNFSVFLMNSLNNQDLPGHNVLVCARTGASVMTDRKSTNFLTLNNISTHVTRATVLNNLKQLSHYFHNHFGDDDVSAFDQFRNSFLCQLTDLTHREQALLS
ncbi:hypothetical protein RF11_08955 [Thelohanellus kitauei]|uniref:Uncharacterized protein n=1 Tax=Thelohanellus kitauei TaxID=669202 RepID=A0A0C2MEE7_THEKT|nr:hypothetical protein RF11_08955 [Thelohanellus kitauei]